MLTQEQLSIIDKEVSGKADAWLSRNLKLTQVGEAQQPKSNRGPKPAMLENPFYGYVGTTTDYGKYPEFAIDVIEGVARLDWYSKKERNIPLSVSKLCMILESQQVVSNQTIQDQFQFDKRHAQRYFKAIELALPRMMACRPQRLNDEMLGVFPEHTSEWDDLDSAHTPTPEELAKLHHDLRTFTEYGSEEFYNEVWGMAHADQYSNGGEPLRKALEASEKAREHPKKAVVLRLLSQGMAVAKVARETGVHRNTVNAWKKAA
ncbi:helix-turn-helix domain-containing protein [Pseudomonas sp. NFACC07-1]|uniref:helix-turn-helix domain-containing protein n=1 Tax=Pseudomonas sp. NFACC07-1 TaxID=1566239 RepID=UPI0008B856C2|nr:helix-turn-helix domain-containing protein [Pseudomonas sp. NFACC07-1]SEI69307.1 Homeodomain-like domain-containing protein [Pseudomonas sp. NFACC07-1]